MSKVGPSNCPKPDEVFKETPERRPRTYSDLLLRLQEESGPKLQKAPLATVFRLAVLEGHSQVKVAQVCGG